MYRRKDSIYKKMQLIKSIKTRAVKPVYISFLPICCFFLVCCSTITGNDILTKYQGPHRLPKTDSYRSLYKPKSQKVNSNPYYQLASYYQMRGDDKKAIGEYKKSVILDPNNAEAYNKMGISYDRLKDFSKAVMSYQMAMALNPELYYVYNNLGFSYTLQGRYYEAIDMFKKAIGLNKENARIRNNLGMVYALTGQSDLAMKEFKLAGGEAWAYYKMACIYYDKGMHEEAKNNYIKSLEINPSYANSQKGLEMYQVLADISQDMYMQCQWLRLQLATASLVDLSALSDS